jgi:hypothetical protein
MEQTTEIKVVSGKTETETTTKNPVISGFIEAQQKTDLLLKAQNRVNRVYETYNIGFGYSIPMTPFNMVVSTKKGKSTKVVDNIHVKVDNVVLRSEIKKTYGFDLDKLVKSQKSESDIRFVLTQISNQITRKFHKDNMEQPSI